MVEKGTPQYDLVVNDVVFERLPEFIASLPAGAKIELYEEGGVDCPTCQELTWFLKPSPADGHRFTCCLQCRDR